MRLRKVKAICRRLPLEELRRVRENLATALLRGALEGTNAREALQAVDLALARRELEGLFKS
ncbi:MAG: hypothetical protein EA420_16485 [Candidatus Competibacteraceae bacterium]|jgi:hypothetical protein|nr:MAG: hypothetical protein EA420_16485 [Candidatus Competibacteraceae bacterium]